jgi:uncharacterized protein YcbK (DUF882 family)
MEKISELNPYEYKTVPNVDKNLQILFTRLLELQAAYGKPFTITSGLRDDAKQQELIKAGKSNAIHSKHLAGAAADVQDIDGELAKYAQANVKLLQTIGLWIEHPNYTKGWVHFQILGPKSGKRVFIP